MIRNQVVVKLRRFASEVPDSGKRLRFCGKARPLCRSKRLRSTQSPVTRLATSRSTRPFQSADGTTDVIGITLSSMISRSSHPFGFVQTSHVAALRAVALRLGHREAVRQPLRRAVPEFTGPVPPSVWAGHRMVRPALRTHVDECPLSLRPEGHASLSGRTGGRRLGDSGAGRIHAFFIGQESYRAVVSTAYPDAVCLLPAPERARTSTTCP